MHYNFFRETSQSALDRDHGLLRLCEEWWSELVVNLQNSNNILNVNGLWALNKKHIRRYRIDDGSWG